MSEWLPIPEDAGNPIKRMVDREHVSEAVRKERTLLDRRKYDGPPKDEEKKTPRYYEEVLHELEPGSSLWVFGSGHSTHCNGIRSLANLGPILATDIVEESGKGLTSSIEFRIHDILKEDIETFDYIFSSHTIEHFTRDQLMETILPKCLNRAREAVVFIAPYKARRWGKEQQHLVQLDERDELAAQAVRYKIIGKGSEIVLWFEGQAE